MKIRTLGTGTYPVVTGHGSDIWAAWQDGARLVLASFDPSRMDPSGDPRILAETFRTSWHVGEPTVYPDLTSRRGQLFLAYREGTDPYRARLENVMTSAFEFLDDRGDGPDQAHGERPIKFGGDDIAWQSSGNPTWDVWRRPIAGGRAQRVRTGVGTGLSRVLADRVTTIDEDRTELPGYTRPSWAGEFVVAEGPQGGAYCRFGDRELLVWPGQTANTPRCAMHADRLAVVAWGAPWNVRIAVFAVEEMHPIGEGALPPFGRRAFVGGFYVTTDRYPEVVREYPQNVEVIVEASAIARARTLVIAAPDALAGVADPSRVIGLYVAAEEEGTAAALDLAAELARAAWRGRFPAMPVPAVVGYVTRGMTAKPTWPPRSVDVFAPECYFDAASSAAGVEALVSGWAHVLSATRPWLLVAQSYDRTGTQRDLMAALAAASPAYLDALRARPWILGILWFAVQRPGSVRDYPALLAAHRRIFAAVPGAPATLPVSVSAPPPDPPQPPDPGEPAVMKITIPQDGYDKFGRVGHGVTIRFQLESDVPVTSLKFDYLGDGREGVTIRGDDLRDIDGLSVRPRRAGLLRLQMTAENARGERDQTSADSRATLIEG